MCADTDTNFTRNTVISTQAMPRLKCHRRPKYGNTNSAAKANPLAKVLIEGGGDVFFSFGFICCCHAPNLSSTRATASQLRNSWNP